MEQGVEENRKTLIRALLLPYSKYASRRILRRRHPLVARLIQFTSKPSDLTLLTSRRDARSRQG
jgi:hypothetical protein